MPTKFQDHWLTRKDVNKTVVGLYAAKVSKDVHSCFCTICNREFKISKGFEKIDQHAKSAIHRLNLPKIKSQLTFVTKPAPTSDVSPSLSCTEVNSSKSINTSDASNLIQKQDFSLCDKSVSDAKHGSHKLSLHNPREEAIKAELLWCLDMICSKSSDHSCYGKRELFNLMFPGAISEFFTLSPRKASYIITDALGPYFHNKLLDDLKQENVTFSLQFDDTSNKENKKELQVRIIYWSNSEGIVINRHLVTKFIQKADGASLFNHLLESLDSNGLALKQILTLGRDGPNVNKKVYRLFEEKLKSLNYKSLLNIGSCYIHIVNNAFQKGLAALSLDVSDFIIKVYYFFERSDLRCNNFTNIQNELKLPRHKFLVHVSTRWLTIGPAADRVDEQLPALEYYFLKYIPSKEPDTVKKQSYLDIVKYLKDPFLKCILQFTSYIATVFAINFTRFMQKNEPLVHLVYSQLQKLIMLLVSSIIKQKVECEKEKFTLSAKIFDDNKIENVLKDSTKALPMLEINCGDKMKTTIKTITEKNQLLMFEIQKFYKAAILHINFKITNRRILKYFKCIDPENIKNSESSKYKGNDFAEIAKSLPLYDIDINELICEWKCLQLDEDVHFSLEKNERIDTYWGKIFDLKISSNSRYHTVSRVVKAILSLPHGSADVERGFSESGLQLTKDRTNMSERTLNARLIISDALKKYDNLAYKVPITKELIKLGQTAYRSYQNYLEEQRKIEAERRKQEAISAEEKAKEQDALNKLNRDIKDLALLQKDLESAKKSYKEAADNTEAMEKIIRETSKSNLNVNIVQQLMTNLQKLKKKEKKLRDNVDNLQELIRKKNNEALKQAITTRFKNDKN